MDMTEFVAKHGDPSRPGYAAQHPNGGGKPSVSERIKATKTKPELVELQSSLLREMSDKSTSKDRDALIDEINAHSRTLPEIKYDKDGNVITKKPRKAGLLDPSPNTPPSDVGITVAEDKKVFSLAENAKRTGNLASESSPAVSGDGRENYKKINRIAAQAHQNVADALEPKLYEMVDGEKAVRTGLASDTKKNLVTAIDWYSNKAMSFMDASRTLSATSGSVPEGSTPYRRF